LFVVGLSLAVSLPVGAQNSSGTGFFINMQGVAATNFHVIDGASKITVTDSSGQQRVAEVVRIDRANDLALIAVPGSNTDYIPIQSSTLIRRGERVYTMGFPRIDVQGLEPKLTDGVISSLSGLADQPSAFQISNPIQPGNSGGPLFTDEGRVVGIVVSTLNAGRMLANTGSIPQNVNYAVKSNYLLELVASVGSLRLPNEPRRTRQRKLTDIVVEVEKALVRITAYRAVPPASALSSRTEPVLSGTLAKVKDTGVITLGVREAGAPLSYTVGNGKYVGYSIAICEKIVASLESQIGRKLDVRYIPVLSSNRIPMLVSGAIDIECGTTTNNLARQKDVDFLPTIFVLETRIGTRATSGINSIRDLNGKVVASTAGTTSIQLLRRHPQASGVRFTEVYGSDHAKSYLLLESGSADAFVMDDAILAGLMTSSKNGHEFRIVGEPLSFEPISIMVRKDDSAFGKLAADTVVGTMQSGEIEAIYNRWFMRPIPPKNSVLNLPVNASTRSAWSKPNVDAADVYNTR
jgi:glutamate/aspartate transport system substrate-binding protein